MAVAFPTVREVPELRSDLLDYYSSASAAAMLAGLTGLDLSAARAASTGQRVRLAEAGLYFVNDDMTTLAAQLGRGLETFAVSPEEDLPEDHGLLLWSRRLDIAPDPDGLTFAPLAVAWSAIGRHVDVTLYDHLPTAEPVLADAWRHQLQRAGTLAGQVPDLVQMWQSRLIADGRDRPWSATEDTDPGSHQVLRTLLATWLLLRQPAAGRKPLHQIEQVPAPRSAQKRIARGGGDPTRTVQYVTLRRAVRREETDAAGPGPGPGEHTRVYQHRWFVAPHRVNQYYPSTGQHERRWRGPYLCTPAGCESAPILGGERVHVLRR